LDFEILLSLFIFTNIKTKIFTSAEDLSKVQIKYKALKIECFIFL